MEKLQEGTPTVILADAVNQLAMIVEELVFATHQPGYTIENKQRRRRWQKIIREQREAIAELIPHEDN